MKKQVVLSDKRMVGTGWRPPLPDVRDYTAAHPKLAQTLRKLGLKKKLVLPDKIDLRQWCSPVQEQGVLGACTAHAAAAIVEYFENRSFSHAVSASRLFIYKNARNLQGVSGDEGAYIRDTMGALALCGAPPEKYWPYTDQDPDFDKDPTAFVYAVADNYEALQYFCHDAASAKVTPDAALRSVKKYLAGGIPSMFGLYDFTSFEACDTLGGVPVPVPGPDETAEWGHAVAAFGYDDTIKLTNTRYDLTTTGALLICNCWGTAWGDKGYGWLPYDYVRQKKASDFWSLLGMKWLETRQFGF